MTLNTFRKHVITEFAPAIHPFVAARAEGALIWDAEGREYVDGLSGIAVTNAGHGRREILDAARAQLDRIVHTATYVTPHAPAAELAAALASVAPGGLTKCFFGSSGAEANEAALRLAKQFTGRSEFIALYGGFHGRTLATLSVSGLLARKRGGGPYMPGVAFAPAPDLFRGAYGGRPEDAGRFYARLIEDVIRFATSGNVAAFIAEPIQGDGGILVPPPGYFAAVREVLDHHKILLLVDEVQTGFSRTGTLFAMEQEGVAPDLLTLGKGIANGFPLSAMMTRPEIAAAFKPGDHLSTFGGNPVSCAAACATLALHRRERLAERAAALGGAFLEALRRRLAGDPRVGEVRGRGLMIGVEFVSDGRKTPAPDVARQVRERCLDQGVLLGVCGVFGNVVRIQPPLVITSEQLERIGDTVAASLRQIP